MEELLREYGQVVLAVITGVLFLGILLFAFVVLNGNSLETVIQGILG